MSKLDELQKLCDEADLFEMRFIVNRKFGEVLNEEDLETVNGFFEWHCMSDEEAKLLD